MSYPNPDTYGQRAAEARDIRTLQADVTAWVEHNFPDTDRCGVVLGLCEEVGEIARAALKQSQGIRGTAAEWDAEVRKETADAFIKLCDVARIFGFDLADAVNTRWADVRQRDWQADKLGHGIGGAA